MTQKFRQLDTRERKFVIQNIERMKEELEEINYDIKMAEIDLTVGINLKTRRAKRMQENNLRELSKALNTIKVSITEAERQLKEGVLIKNEVKE